MAPMKRPSAPHPEFEGTMSVTQAARRLHLTHKQVRHMLGTGKLNFVQVRRKFRIPTGEVKALVRKTTGDA